MAEGRSLRFAARRLDKYSPVWKLTTTATRSEAYLTLRGLDLHVSLHESPEHWHVKIRGLGLEHHRAFHWHRPDEFYPGLVFALSLCITPAVVTDDEPPRPERVHFTVSPGGETWNVFDVMLQSPTYRASSDWPGQSSMGTDLVGRLSMPNGWTLVVVHRLEAGVSMTRNAVLRAGSTKQEMLDALRERPAKLRSLVFWERPEGAISIIHVAASVPEADGKP